MDVDLPWKRFWYRLGVSLSLTGGGFVTCFPSSDADFDRLDEVV